MDKASFVYMLIEALIFLGGLAVFVWKFSSKITSLEKDVEQLRLSDVKQDSQYSTILSTMNDIQMSIVRLETKFEVKEKVDGYS